MLVHLSLWDKVIVGYLFMAHWNLIIYHSAELHNVSLMFELLVYTQVKSVLSSPLPPVQVSCVCHRSWQPCGGEGVILTAAHTVNTVKERIAARVLVQ